MTILHIDDRLELQGADLGMPCVIQVGFDRICRPIPLEEHVHAGFEFTYIDEGRVVWELGDGSDLTLQGGDMALTQPMMPHKGQFDVISPASLFWISFDFSEEQNLRNTLFSPAQLLEMLRRLRAAGNFSHYAGTRIPRLLSDLYVVLRQPPSGDDHDMTLAFIHSHINMLFTLIFQESGNLNTRQETSYSARAKRYIEENIDRKLLVNDIAQTLGISISYVHEVFRNDVGMTPHDYAQRRRCEIAMTYLRESDRSITSIATELGFSSTQYFSTCLKRYTGLNPSQYRLASTATRTIQ